MSAATKASSDLLSAAICAALRFSADGSISAVTVFHVRGSRSSRSVPSRSCRLPKVRRRSLRTASTQCFGLMTDWSDEPVRKDSTSLNLSTSVAISMFERKQT